MRINLVRADVGYRSNFGSPNLDLIRQSLQMLGDLKESVAKETQLKPEDLSIQAGSSVSDFRLLVRLPALQGSVELTAMGTTVQFAGLSKYEGIQTAFRCIRLADTSVWKILTETKPVNSSVGFAGWYKIEGGRDGLSAYLGSLATLNADFAQRLRRDIVLSQKTIKLDFADKENDWSAVVILDQSALTAADLFVDCTVVYPNPNFCASIDARLSHFPQVLGELMKCLKLEDEAALAT